MLAAWRLNGYTPVDSIDGGSGYKRETVFPHSASERTVAFVVFGRLADLGRCVSLWAASACSVCDNLRASGTGAGSGGADLAVKRSADSRIVTGSSLRVVIAFA